MPDTIHTTSLPVLFLSFANDRTTEARYLRNLPVETRHLREALSNAEASGLCQVVIRTNATLAEIIDVLQHPDYRDRIAVLHFGGHATSYELLFETDSGAPAPASSAAFATLLAEQRSLAVVFLNGCSTEAHAQALLDTGVSVVIATTQAIADSAATEFATRFYQALAGGAPVHTAFQQATTAMRLAYADTFQRLYGPDAGDSLWADRWPWQLYQRPGAEEATAWSLPQAAGDPLFGLPELPAMELPDSPYRHLHWYREADAEVFFGRGHEIRDLYERVTAAHEAPIILLYGQSGVGKSSLLAAGLLPRLRTGHAFRYARRDQALGLLGTLQQALAPGAGVQPISASWSELETREAKPLLVVLDQVEECFTRPNPALPAELTDLLAALHTALADPEHRPRGKLILSFRKEWLAEIEKQMGEHKLHHTRVFVQRLERPGIVQVVTGPARTARLRRQYGLNVETNVADLIADNLLADLGSPVAPVLQILLARMWERAQALNHDHPRFDPALYHDLRREGLGLGDFVDMQLAALHSTQPGVVESGLALDLLALHTTRLGTAEEIDVTVLRQVYHHQDAAIMPLLQRCQDLYLLVDPASNEPGRMPASRLAHDTLAPVVRVRFDESDRPGQRARRILENRAVEWQDERRGSPLDAQDLRLVERGASGMRAWTPVEERLVKASRAALRARRRKQWLTPLLVTLVVALMALASWTGYRVWLRHQALRDSPQVHLEGGMLAIGTDDPALSGFAQPETRIGWPDFDIDRYEVSNGLYCLCNRAGACPDHAYGEQPVCAADIAARPVTGVSLKAADDYCRWLGRRVPAEIEWERAARGAENRIYPTGNTPPTAGDVNIRPNAESEGQLWATTEMRRDVTAEGVAGLVGNVSEWTISAPLSYTLDVYPLTWWPALPEEVDGFVVLRGGSYRDLVPTRSSERLTRHAAEGADFVGFRCVQGLSDARLHREVMRLNKSQ